MIEAIYTYLKEVEEELVTISKNIFDNPELGLEEYFASKLLSEYLTSKGFQVTQGVGKLDTAFVASFEQGVGGYHVAYCSEYDALPKLGHACGHNLIGVASIGAAISLVGALKKTEIPFKVSVIGTPDEEGTGGKIDLIKEGVFDSVDVAMMFHPGFETVIDSESLAVRTFDFIFKGKTSHAASEPWEGRNALDGVLLMFQGIQSLRQHVKPDVRLHGVILEGGKANNVIPDYAVTQFGVRSLDNEYLEYVVSRVFQCAKGAALMADVDVEIKEICDAYEAMNSNRVLGSIFKESLDETGYVDITQHKEGLGSLDMGNVSNVVPSIHPVISLTSKMVPAHTIEFADMCNSNHAYEVLIQVCHALALTGYKVMNNKDIQRKIKEEFNRK